MLSTITLHLDGADRLRIDRVPSLSHRPYTIRALYSARSSKPDRCQYSRQTSFRARHYLLFTKIGRKSGYFGRIDLNGRPYLKQYIIFSNISNSQLEIYARNTTGRVSTSRLDKSVLFVLRHSGALNSHIYSNPRIEFLTLAERISILVRVGHCNKTGCNLVRRHRIVVEENETSVSLW